MELCIFGTSSTKVADKSLTSASETLNVSRPSLSVQIRDLEEEPGIGYSPNGPARVQDDIGRSGRAVS